MDALDDTTMPTTEKIYSVTELNSSMNELLSSFDVTVSGELSDFRIWGNQYVYFDLKDEQSKISCFLAASKLQVSLEDGMEVKIHGRPGVYVKRGSLTFRVDTIEPVGEGALRRALELTRKKLEALGLFDPAHKQSLPPFPERIGIITSPDAAAYTDVLRILKNRWAGLEIALAPVRVQGDGAIAEIVSALQHFNEEYPVDVIILTRGGGSMEDLSAFNAEDICRAVFSSRIPVIAAVGHERDVTLVEYAADVRASTPSNAAELVVPDKGEWRKRLSMMQSQMYQHLIHALTAREETLLTLAEGLTFRMKRQSQTVLGHYETLHRLLSTHNPTKVIETFYNKTQDLGARLEHSMGECLSRIQEKFSGIIRVMHSLSPHLPLSRGYSLSSIGDKLIRSVQDVKPSDILMTQLLDGHILSKITETMKKL